MLNSPGDHLTHCQKEKLLERMYWKDQFTEDNLQIIRDNLLSDNLNRNCLPCLDGQVMKLLCPNWSSTVKKGQHGSHKITKGNEPILTKWLYQVDTLKLRLYESLDDTVFSYFGQCVGRRLTHLDLYGCLTVTDTGLISVLKHCPNISILDVSYIRKLTDRGMQAVAYCLKKKLIELEARSLSITCASTKTIADYCPKLTSANFSQCRDLDGTGIYEMAQKCSLKVLKVSDLKLQSLLCLDKLQHNLIELEINSVCSSIDRSTLLHVGKFKVISELTLYSVTLLNDDIVAKIFSSIGHQLTKLHLLNCPELKDISESLVKYCTSLQDLLITGDCLSIQLTSLFTDKRKASLFKAIQLYNDTVPIEVVEAVAASCHNLEHLYCEIEINDVIVFSVARHCSKLKVLHLSNLTDANVCEIATHCHKLTLLCCRSDGPSALTDKSVIALAGNCPNLEKLVLPKHHKITAVAIKYLKNSTVRRTRVFTSVHICGNQEL
ncbi:F-box/LRR-repeat protein 2-like isoform X2 [Dysidea avara]